MLKSKTINKNIIAIVNQKGGVGKTTSIINIASCLAKANKKVMLVDLDPQGNATTGSGIDKNALDFSIYDVLLGKKNLAKVKINNGNLKFAYDIVPSNRQLAGAEIDLVTMKGREYKLRDILLKFNKDYDFILLDCPPSLSLLTLNGLIAAHYILVPMQCEYYALEGLTDLLNTINLLKQELNPDLELLGLIRTMYDKRNNLAMQVSQELLKHFNDKVFTTYIPRTVRLAEAPGFGMSAVQLDSNSRGAKAYQALTEELLIKLSHNSLHHI